MELAGAGRKPAHTVPDHQDCMLHGYSTSVSRERGQEKDTSCYDSDSNDSSSLQESEIPRYLELVAKYMDEFIVRGTHGAMQWMLDLETYGGKIVLSRMAQHSNGIARRLVGIWM